VKFTYQELPDDGAFITAQIERNKVVYSILLAKAKKPLSREEVESHLEGELSKKYGSVQESVSGRDFTRGWALALPGSPPSPSLWECGNPRLMRVSKRRGRSCLGLSTVDPARHFHSELTDSAHFDEKRPSGTP
jgi:hypothetical protein